MKRQLLGILIIAILAGIVGSVRSVEAQNPTNGVCSPYLVCRVAGLWINTKLLWDSRSPTVSSGFGTNPSISSNNGNATFRVNVGTGGTATTGVLTLPQAANGWNCIVTNTAAPVGLAFITLQTATTTTSVSLAGYRDDGAAFAWASGATLLVTCNAY